jgi:hypothetical protein
VGKKYLITGKFHKLKLNVMKPLATNEIQVWLVACFKLPLTLMRVINFNNLNSERIMKTETITDHDLSKIAEDWYKGIEHVDTGLKTAFAAGYRFAERQANGHDTGERQLTIPDVSGSLPEPTMQELEDMIDYINTQVAADQLDDFMDKAGKLNNFVKKYQRQ